MSNKNSIRKKIIIVGAGPGGLTAGMLLSSFGFEVEMYEKENRIGGRNGYIEKDGFKFDIGPTFLMLKPILDKVFQEAGENIDDYLKFFDLDPMYRLIFEDKKLDISPDHAKTEAEIKKHFPGEEKGFRLLLEKEQKRFNAAYPCLQKDYSSFWKLFNKQLLKFLPKLSFPNSMYCELGKYFESEDLKLAFTFQSKYIGMSPKECPAAFMIIPFIEHNFGIQHVQGGLSEISVAMEKVIIKNGGKIFTNSQVKKISDDRIFLESGEEKLADRIIVNADIGYACEKLLKGCSLKNKNFSCSTFMLYLGLDQKLDWEHHSIFFSRDYHSFLDSIFKTKKLSDDISFYARNASNLDKSLAPEGKSALYILVPVPNNSSGIDWEIEKERFRNLVLDQIEKKSGCLIRNKIISENLITPEDWEKKYNVYLGATFNLAHSLNQMLYFRPHNQISKKIFLTGGGTHPGSGLPTIYESARISSKLINDSFK